MKEFFWYAMFTYFALLLVQGALCLVRKKSDFWALAYARTAQLTQAGFWAYMLAFVAWTMHGAYTDLIKAIEKGNVVLAKQELGEFLYATGFAFFMAFCLSMVMQSRLRDLFNGRRCTSAAPRVQELGADDTLYGSCDV